MLQKPANMSEPVYNLGGMGAAIGEWADHSQADDGPGNVNCDAPGAP